MDDIDRKILDLIQGDGRISAVKLGEAVGLSPAPVTERLRKLQQAGIIQGFQARLDPAAMGCPILAFVQVLIERPEHEAAFLAMVRDTQEILECHHVTGEWSYLLKIRAADMAGLESLLARRLKALPGIPRSHTVIALSSAKDEAALPILC